MGLFDGGITYRNYYVEGRKCMGMQLNAGACTRKLVAKGL